MIQNITSYYSCKRNWLHGTKPVNKCDDKNRKMLLFKIILVKSLGVFNDSK